MWSAQDVLWGPNPPQLDALTSDTRTVTLQIGGTWPQVAMAWQDVPYLRTTHEALNSTLREQAAANNATYVDAYSASVGRDACKSSSVRCVEPTVPLNPAAPLHPNARGMRGVASVVLGALGK